MGGIAVTTTLKEYKLPLINSQTDKWKPTYCISFSAIKNESANTEYNVYQNTEETPC